MLLYACRKGSGRLLPGQGREATGARALSATHSRHPRILRKAAAYDVNGNVTDDVTNSLLLGHSMICQSPPGFDIYFQPEGENSEVSIFVGRHGEESRRRFPDEQAEEPAQKQDD